MAGGDANWGRVVMAVGKAGEPAERDRLAIRFGPTQVARDGFDGRVDVVEAKAIASAAVCRKGASAQADDADAARSVSAAEADGEANAGVVRVIGGGCVDELGREDLRAVADAAVGQRAFGVAPAIDVLLHAKRAVEVALGEERIPLIGDVLQAEQEEEECRAGKPQQAL